MLVSGWDFCAGAQDCEAKGHTLTFQEGPGALADRTSSASSKWGSQASAPTGRLPWEGAGLAWLATLSF